jgi:hemerythrin
MAKLEWKPDYETHVGSVDAQHRKLFDLLQGLEDGIAQGQATEAIANTLRGVVAYINDHFSYEESLFKEHLYSRTEEHLAQHESLKKYVVMFLKDIRGERGVSPVELLRFLKTWWNHHILTHDFQYAEEFRDKGVTVENDDLIDFLTKRSRKVEFGSNS